MSAVPPESASSADLLAAAEQGSGKGKNIARAAAINDGAFSIALGALVASFLLCVEYVFPTHVPVLVGAATALYAVSVIGLVLWHLRRRRASRAGWSKRYSVGLAITIAFYGIGVALSVGDTTHSLAFWLPYAVLTAAPLVVAALWRDRA